MSNTPNPDNTELGEILMQIEDAVQEKLTERFGSKYFDDQTKPILEAKRQTNALISKARIEAEAQIFELLESKAEDVHVRSQPMPGSIHRSYTYKAIPLSAINELRSK